MVIIRSLPPTVCSKTYCSAFGAIRLGRTRCENLTPYEAPCSFGYGETVAVTKNFVAHWGYTLSDDMLSLVSATVQENLDFPASGFPTSGNDGQDGSSGDGQDGNFGSNGEGSFSDTNTLSFSNQAYAELNNFLSLAFNNFYEFILTRDYIEARGYSVTVPVKPTSSLEYQTWVSTTHIRYRWRVIIGARGGLIISAFGRPIGDLHSLSDLSYYEDLFFNLYGTYEYPLTAEIVFTMDKDLGASWPLNLESESIGDRVRSVARNGQFGYR